MTAHLTLTTSTGAIVQVPVRLPESIRFDCYVPGVGVKSAWLEPTTLDPADAMVRTVEVGGREVTHQARGGDAAILEQATVVLDCILAALTPEHPHATLARIADLAGAESALSSAVSALPDAVRRLMRAPPTTCHALLALRHVVDLVCEQAHLASTKEAKRREALWLEEHGLERHEANWSSRTDAVIDRYKDETP